MLEKGKKVTFQFFSSISATGFSGMEQVLANVFCTVCLVVSNDSGNYLFSHVMVS